MPAEDFGHGGQLHHPKTLHRIEVFDDEEKLLAQRGIPSVQGEPPNDAWIPPIAKLSIGCGPSPVNLAPEPAAGLHLWAIGAIYGFLAVLPAAEFCLLLDLFSIEFPLA